LAIDADGAPNAYAPKGTPALDYLANAGHPGDWYGIVTDNGQGDGNPVVQESNDPCPGSYVSTTALVDHSRGVNDPLRYVNSSMVPYISVPPQLRHAGVKLGDVCNVTYGCVSCAAVVADVGPSDSIGEGSIALANTLGINGDPKHGGVSSGVSVTLWAASTQGWPRDMNDVENQVQQLLSSAGFSV
jgi:hypothetical protein